MWTSVRDGVPEDRGGYKVYLVVMKTAGGPLPEGYYRSIEKASYFPADPGDDNWPGNTAYWEIEDEKQGIPFEVTHWMEYPELPEV